jgi:hypothetical protein
VWILLAQGSPESPNTKLVAEFVGTLEQYDGAPRELGLPALKVMPDSFVCMESIYMQEIHCPIGKMSEGFIEGRAKQRRKRAVALVMKTAKLLEHLIAILARVRFTAPRIHSVAAGFQTGPRDCLTKS